MKIRGEIRGEIYTDFRSEMRIIRRIIRCMRRLPCIWSIIRYLAWPAKKGIYSIYTAYTGVYANSCHITANHVLMVDLVILQCPKQPVHNYSLNKLGGATVLCTADALSFYSATQNAVHKSIAKLRVINSCAHELQLLLLPADFMFVGNFGCRTNSDKLLSPGQSQ